VALSLYLVLNLQIKQSNTKRSHKKRKGHAKQCPGAMIKHTKKGNKRKIK
jgi:hypothetical protein